MEILKIIGLVALTGLGIVLLIKGECVSPI